MIRGMPNIPGGAGGILPAGINALISFGGAFAIGLIFGERWGVFNQFGIPILLADNVTSVQYQTTANVANAPLEKGTFTSYNKTQEPFTATVQMTKGSGGTAGRGLFIAQLEALKKSTLLYNVLTPEYVHRNATITGFGYKRSVGDGNRMIVATLDLKEIREVDVQYSREIPSNPADAARSAAGEVQGRAASQSILFRAVQRLRG